MGVTDSTAETRQVANGSAGAAAYLLERMADQLGGKASVRAAYGEPVVGDGVTVIPVARVGFGFGGGTGSGPARTRARDNGQPGVSEGGGGGGGAEARPLGFIEIKDKAARYRPIRDPWTDVVVPLAVLAVAIIAPKVVRAAARLRRR